ncbi:MAG: RagB/SusD family nutrient uptake outer membrane protein [Dysgonomonas sp.]
MKKTIKNILLILMIFQFTSCSDYFDSVPKDTQDLDMIFDNRVLALQWLSNVYSYLPDESEQNYTGGSDETRGIWTPASIEADLPWEYCNSNLVNSGTLNPSSDYVKNMWKAYYRGIQKANIYMQRVDACPDMDAPTKLRTKAEARALRSIYYFNLFKIYGPFVIVGDRIFDNEAGMSTMLLTRSSVDECIKYITDEFDAVLQDGNLFSHFGSDGKFQTQFAGNITKEAVEAIRSQVLLYAASNLFNGDPYYKDLVDADGNHLFPQSRDDEKWRKAKVAAKNFIDNNPGFQLVFRNLDGTNATTIVGSCPYNSVSESFLGRQTNEEMIFYSTRNGWNLYYYMKPKHSGITDAQSGAGALTVPLQMVDLFFTKNGLRITDDPTYFNYTNDDESKFTARQMTSVDTYKDQYSGYTYFTPTSSYRIMNQFYNREPRFYIAFTFQNRRWDFDESKTYYTDFSLNGNSGKEKNGHVYPKSGILARKKLYKSGSVPYNIFIRLTEIYLNYAEACAELGEYSEAINTINLIRARAGVAEYGLNGDASLGTRGEARIPITSTDVLSAVRRERLVELAYENQHYFDVRRWGVAGMAQGDGWIYPTWHQGGEGGNMMGFDVLVDMASGATGNTMYFYKKKNWETRIYTERMKLFPIPQTEVNVNKKMVQNTGWAN